MKRSCGTFQALVQLLHMSRLCSCSYNLTPWRYVTTCCTLVSLGLCSGLFGYIWRVWFGVADCFASESSVTPLIWSHKHHSRTFPPEIVTSSTCSLLTSRFPPINTPKVQPGNYNSCAKSLSNCCAEKVLVEMFVCSFHASSCARHPYSGPALRLWSYMYQWSSHGMGTRKVQKGK